MVTDAVLQDDMLAVSTHLDMAFQVHFIKLDTANCHAEYLYAETISQGEVTALSLYKVADRIHAVACLSTGNDILIERYCITDRTLRYETSSLNDGTFRPSSPL